MEDVRIIVHMQPDEVLVERGRTHGMIDCARCKFPTEHYVTGPDDEVTPVTTWRCTECEDLVDLHPKQTILAIYALEAMRSWRKTEEVTS